MAKAADPVAQADYRWRSVRRSEWFGEVVRALKSMVGNGEPCMYCDSNEAAEVEHSKPKSVFPKSAFEWENLLWVCGICNRLKGAQYPPITQPGAEILNPVAIDPWQYMFLEERTGLLSGLWRKERNTADERAESTIQIVDLNREALQERRRQRINELKRFALDTRKEIDAGLTDPREARGRIAELKKSAIQPDVADYFLAGPGKDSEPFKSLFTRIER